MPDFIVEEGHHDLIRLARFMEIFVLRVLIVYQAQALHLVPLVPTTLIQEAKHKRIVLHAPLDFSV